MHKIIALILATLFLSLVHTKLYQVVAVISPGARYPVNDLYDGGETRAKWGEITSVGLRQQQSLGKQLRKEYIDNYGLLSKNFVKEEFQLITMTINRTIQSGLANLYGMYALGNGQKLNPAESIYHIPPYSNKSDIPEATFSLPQGQLIQTVSYISALIESCPNEDKQIQKNIRAQLTDYNEMVLTYTPFLKKMASTFNIETSSMNFTKLSALYDTVRSDKYLGRKLPTSLTQQDFANLQHLYNWHKHFTYSFDLAKAYNTYKFNEVLASFDNKIKNINTQAKWVTISVNEIDIIAAQNGLKIASASCIEQLYRTGSSSALNCEGGSPFASSLIFQLHSDNGADFSVRVRNNGKYVNLCGLKQTTCPYNTWKGQVKQSTIADPLSVCGKSQSEEPMILAQ